jgi:acetolactate synthase-1/2/3 large subunit
METATGAELFVGAMLSLGIRQVFTLVGDHLNEVLAVMRREGVGILDMRHESAVTHAADAWARIHRRPALALVTGGPGHTNALTGIATAALAASPLIAVSGSRASTLADRQSFQDIDQLGIARPVVKWAAQPADGAQIPFCLARAFREANTGRRGAVHLTIPVDLFTKRVPAPADMPLPAEPSRPAPDPRDVERALALLREAERPVVIAGSAVWWSGAEQELLQFVEAAQLPLYTITMARCAIPDAHPLSMGYADPALNRAAWLAFQEADLFLVLGKRIDYRLALGTTRLFPAAARFIQVDIHPPELGMNRKLDVAICADLKAALRALVDGLECSVAATFRSPSQAITEEAPGGPKTAATPLGRGKTAEWLGRVRALRDEWQTWLAEQARDGSAPIHPAAFYRALETALPPDVLYSWDGGDFTHWGRAMLPARHAGGWLRLGPLGTIGASLPNGLALQLAHPGRPVAVITGDGALGFYIAEMDTAVRHRLPVVLIVGNDAGWGLERELQREMSGSSETVGCELRPTRYDVVMKGFGGDGETIDSLDHLRPAVERAFSSGVPYCLNVNVRGARSPFTEWQILGKRL